ncbi:Echinoderm microtubule-associated protein-like 3 [Lonchura striata]|uniref:Echinoderm microtubule-associated protein-like 3 n=1 Tax=Lonchura striata TaxID=40157 RepID=A0A218UB67_9PASE|nr:Echinoderm microtubule-associated protein-like 3 [Lonchura striata domestica]
MRLRLRNVFLVYFVVSLVGLFCALRELGEAGPPPGEAEPPPGPLELRLRTVERELALVKAALGETLRSYGYRGRDSRSNLHVLGSGELVYFIACVVVLLQLPARRQRHYLRHSDCVRCLAVHPDRLRVATGQAAGVDKDGKNPPKTPPKSPQNSLKSPKIPQNPPKSPNPRPQPLQPIVHIWDSATLQTLQQIGLGSFERGVGSLAFSTADQGAFLCVVDDSNEHMMSKYKKPKFIQCFIFDAAGALLTGDSEGNILTWTRTPGKGGKGGAGVWRDVAGGCKLLRNRFESRDREWASYTCVLGFHVFGGSGGSGGLRGGLGGFPISPRVWPDGSDGTDINSLCRSHHERVVAVADDFCKVHLFQYPCARAKAPSHVYGGHGSHVTNVRFTHDDGHLVSLGGKDTSVFQWRVLPGDSA